MGAPSPATTESIKKHIIFLKSGIFLMMGGVAGVEIEGMGGG